ncbi:unnamed protein product [Prorocentrum cordatum]|uniref:Protein kinase domain-containing protein n=1 Tax=Prorocentrum cordatum TaxID=2364126 RepID=A0ABN9VEK7_9DINO|nr:unnamed protein product [Polarella glacialis]
MFCCAQGPTLRIRIIFAPPRAQGANRQGLLAMAHCAPGPSAPPPAPHPSAPKGAASSAERGRRLRPEAVQAVPTPCARGAHAPRAGPRAAAPRSPSPARPGPPPSSAAPAAGGSPAERPADSEQVPLVLVPGSRIEYFSRSNGCWMPVRVARVDAETGEVVLDVKPNSPLSLEEQRCLLRPRTQPGPSQLDWVRQVLREGRIEAESEALFERYARPSGGVRLVLWEDALAVGAALDALLGTSGAACCVQQRTEDAGGHGLSMGAFREVFWELLWGVQCECGQAMQHRAVPTLPQSGRAFEEAYDLGRDLGSGTFGHVKMATDRRSGTQHAVKIISKAKMLERPHLDSEVDRLSALDHPNIVKLYGHFEDDQQIYLVMDFCSGGELQSVIFESIDSRQHLREAFVACVICQVLLAISHVHSRGILHLDLKPGNILLMPKKRTLPPGRRPAAGHTLCDLGESPHVMVIDLGVAQVFRPGVFECAGPRGTPTTMAPEAWRGEFTPRADVFSCGVVLFELLTLELPFECPADLDADAARRYWATRPRPPWDIARHRSADAAGMCSAMVALERRKRPEARQCLQAPFLAGCPARAAAAPEALASADPEQGAAAAAARERLVLRLAAAPERSLLHTVWPCPSRGPGRRTSCPRCSGSSRNWTWPAPACCSWAA